MLVYQRVIVLLPMMAVDTPIADYIPESGTSHATTWPGVQGACFSATTRRGFSAALLRTVLVAKHMAAAHIATGALLPCFWGVGCRPHSKRLYMGYTYFLALAHGCNEAAAKHVNIIYIYIYIYAYIYILYYKYIYIYIYIYIYCII